MLYNKNINEGKKAIMMPKINASRYLYLYANNNIWRTALAKRPYNFLMICSKFSSFTYGRVDLKPWTNLVVSSL